MYNDDDTTDVQHTPESLGERIARIIITVMVFLVLYAVVLYTAGYFFARGFGRGIQASLGR